MGTAVGAWALREKTTTSRAKQDSFLMRRPGERLREIPRCPRNDGSVFGFTVFSLQTLEDAGGAHAATDAHGDHAVARVATLQFAEDSGGEFCAGAAERVAEGDGAAVGVDAGGVEAGLLNDGERLRGEGFVELDDSDVAE